MAFDAHDRQIGEILNRAVFDIPRNQRRYVWSRNNWKELLDDIIFSCGSNTTFHFLGSIVLENKGKTNGITTIVLFLIAIMKLFNEYDMEDDFFGTLEYVRVKNNRNQTSPIIFSDFHQSLEVLINAISNYDIVSQQTITSFVESNTISKSKDKLLGDALKYFYSEIKILCEQEEKPGEKILEIRNATIGMTIVSIVSTSEEDAYTIFEILNARGQKLEDYELLKNYIMR